MWWCIVTAMGTLVSHGYLPRVYAMSLVDKWRPKVQGNVVPLFGLHSYLHARTALMDKEATGVIAQATGHGSNVFLVRMHAQATVVLDCLWHAPSANRTRGFERLCEWHHHVSPPDHFLVYEGPADLELDAWKGGTALKE